MYIQRGRMKTVLDSSIFNKNNNYLFFLLVYMYTQ